MKLNIDLNLSADTRYYITQEAARRGMADAAIVAEVLEEVLEEYYREPTKAELLEDIRQGLLEALKQDNT